VLHEQRHDERITSAVFAPHSRMTAMSLLLTIPAGMPSFTLNDVTALRLQTISFFLVAKASGYTIGVIRELDRSSPPTDQNW